MQNEKAREYIRLRMADLADLDLIGTPKPKDMVRVESRWYEILTRKQGGTWRTGDGERLKVAFDELEAWATRWPAPADVLKLMPPRKFVAALPEPGRSDEECAEGLKHIRGILDTLSEGMTVH